MSFDVADAATAFDVPEVGIDAADVVTFDVVPTIPTPRAIAPLSTSTVTSVRPTLHFVLASGTDGAVVDVCRDRLFTHACVQLQGTSSVRPSSPLSAGVWFWRLHGTQGSSEGANASAPWEFLVGARDTPTDTSWGSMLDVNGDGIADVAVGAPTATSGGMTNVGTAYLYMGSTAGLSNQPTAALVGPDGPYGTFGWSVASAGDVNGDGYGDLVIGAACEAGATTPGVGDNAGRAYLYLGSGVGLSTTPIPLPGSNTANNGFGWAVAGIGDTNGDGYGDVAVTDGPQTRVFYGDAHGVSPTLAPTVLARKALFLSAADFDADGYADLLAGDRSALSFVGQAFVFRGGSGGVSSTANTTLTGPDGAGGQFGDSVVAAGDVDGNGYVDILVGAPDVGSVSNGRAYLYPVSSLGVAATPIDLSGLGGRDASFGGTVAAAGDPNGDGYADVVIGANSENHVYLFQGGAGGVMNTPSATITVGASASALSMADTNGDGYVDLLVGAQSLTAGRGALYVFDGTSAGTFPTTPTLTYLGPDGAGGYFGQSVATWSRRAPPCWMPRSPLLLACVGRLFQTTFQGRTPLPSADYPQTPFVQVALLPPGQTL